MSEESQEFDEQLREEVKEYKEIKDFIIHDNFLNAQRKERARKRIIEKIDKLAGEELIWV